MLSDAHLSFSIDPIKDLEKILSLEKNKEIIKTAIILIKNALSRIISII